MKKKEFLQDSIGLIDDDIVKEAKEEPRRKSMPWARPVAVAACVAILAAAIPVGFLIADRATPHVDGGEGTENNSEEDATVDTTPQFDENGREIWVDDRNYKEGADAYGEEMGYIWQWEYLDIYEKYRLIDTDDKKESYCYIGTQIPEELLGEYLGEMIAYGYDDGGAGGRYEIDCIAYSIKGAPDKDAIAVKLDGTDEFVTYRIIHNDYEHPATLGKLISMKNLTETLSINSFSYDHDDDFRTPSVRYLISPEQSEHIWQILIEKCSDAESVDGDSLFLGSSDIGFRVSSIPLGIKSKSISIYENGFLGTNIMEYGDYFFIGKSVVNEIIEYVLTDPKEAPESTSKWVAGTITEIGEDYFKINDAPMMENEEDGIEFTVKTTDIKILRYFQTGILKVGDTAYVEYDGHIYADDPTTIDSAYSINECHIYGGDAYIPE